MKKLVLLWVALGSLSSLCAQTQTAYLDLYQRGGGQHLKTTLIFDGTPLSLGRRNLGEMLNILAQQGWEVDQTLAGAARWSFITRHKFHIVLKKSYESGENPFKGLHDKLKLAPYAVAPQAPKAAVSQRYVNPTDRGATIRYTTTDGKPLEIDTQRYPELTDNGVEGRQHVIAVANGYIPAGAFRDCDRLLHITIESGILTIGPDAFNGCNKLKQIICRSKTPPVLGIGALDGIATTAWIQVPRDSKEVYVENEGWGEYASIIEEM